MSISFVARPTWRGGCSSPRLTTARRAAQGELPHPRSGVFISDMTQQELPAPLAEMTGLMAECANNGDFAGAALQANELVTLCRATLGERNPNVLELKVALATLQLRAGDDAVAYADLDGLIPDLVEVLGRDHLSTLTARHLFAGRQQPPLSSLSELSSAFAFESS